MKGRVKVSFLFDERLLADFYILRFETLLSVLWRCWCLRPHEIVWAAPQKRLECTVCRLWTFQTVCVGLSIAFADDKDLFPERDCCDLWIQCGNGLFESICSHFFNILGVLTFKALNLRCCLWCYPYFNVLKLLSSYQHIFVHTLFIYVRHFCIILHAFSLQYWKIWWQSRSKQIGI